MISHDAELARYEAVPVRRSPYEGPPDFSMLGGGLDEPQQNASMWATLDDRMRGRWRLAIVIGALLSGILGLAGFFSTVPKYRSIGAIRVTQQVPVILRETGDHHQRDPDRFRSTQAQLLKNTRVLEQALEDAEVKRLDPSTRPATMREIEKGLDVERDRESELIHVWFESEDPLAAQAITNAVLRSYYEIYGRYNGLDVPGTLAELQDTEGRFARELNMFQMERRVIDTAYQTTDLQALQQENIGRLAELDAQIRAGKRELDRLARIQTEMAAGDNEFAPDALMLEQINPMLARRRVEWSEAQVAFDNLSSRYQPTHTTYSSAKAKADRTKELYDKEYQATLTQWRTSGAKIVPGQAGAARLLSPSDISALEVEYAELAQLQSKLVADLTRRDQIKYYEESTQKELDSVRDRIRTLEIESKNLGAFISIAHPGARPDEPYENARRKRAIMGAGLGMLGSFAMFFLIGSIDRRAFGASQLAPKPGSKLPPCLGVLPDLGASFTDPESCDIASHCVHQIRNQIEAIREPNSGYVLAITSPFQGDGKTSIVLALGWSYAAAGYNTLLIDCDLVGRSLTRQLGLVGRDGLRDALVMGELNGSINRTPVSNLNAVPAGLDASFGPENLRRAHLELLLRQVRDKYDIILIDTGPMLGSLECTPVTASADGVLLSVRRGRSRNKLDECVGRLEMVGTRCLGIVLNCAWRSDCNRYVSETSLAAAEEERAARQATDRGADIVQPTMGDRNALVRAMKQSTRLHKNAY